MLFTKYMLLVVGVGMFVTAAAIVANDVCMVVRYRRRMAIGAMALEPPPIRWRTTVALAFLAWAPLLIALSIAVGTAEAATRIPKRPTLTAARYTSAR
jgi:hypothetical protein